MARSKDDEIPLVYRFIYKKFCDKWGQCNTIVLSTELVEIIRRTVYQIPKKYDRIILKEMEENWGLIETINQQKHKINGANANKILKKLDYCYAFW